MLVSPRKRKTSSKVLRPDLIETVTDAIAVPSGLVSNRIAQLGSTSNRTEEVSEVQKKQRVSANTNARSAAAAGSSPSRAQ